jgi:hypothetical protein
MSSLNLTLAMMRASGTLPKSPCAKIDKLKSVEEGAREKRVKVERSAKKQRTKAIQKLTKQVKHEIKEIDETYGKPGKPSKCSPAKKKERVEDSPELRRGTKAEQKEHGRGKKDARQIAADHLAEDPHAYDVKPKAKKPAKPKKPKTAKPKKVKAKKVAKAKKPRASGVDKKTKAAAKREATAAKKRAREEATLAKREARKQAKAAAHRPQYAGETAPTSEAKPKKVKAVRAPKPKAEKPVRAAVKPPKEPKQLRGKKAAATREQVFVADEPAANGAVDADKDAKAMAGFEAMVARMMSGANSGVVESMPSKAKPKPKPGYVYVWSDDESFSESDTDAMSERHYIGARYTGRLAGDGSMFNTWKLKDGRNIAQTAIG